MAATVGTVPLVPGPWWYSRWGSVSMTQQRQSQQPPTRGDIEEARDFIAPYLPRTPLVHSLGLSGLLGCSYHVKCENFQPVGAFKVRGGGNLVGRLGDEAGAGGGSASTGNHG